MECLFFMFVFHIWKLKYCLPKLITSLQHLAQLWSLFTFIDSGCNLYSTVCRYGNAIAVGWIDEFSSLVIEVLNDAHKLKIPFGHSRTISFEILYTPFTSTPLILSSRSVIVITVELSVLS